ncbi:MAG: hypothetical protein ACLFWL_13500 [Candidatus Brocadiia bacterium]
MNRGPGKKLISRLGGAGESELVGEKTVIVWESLSEGGLPDRRIL